MARDGVLLAGEWTTPDSQKRSTVSYPDLANGLEVAADHINMAVSQLLKMKRRDATYGNNTLCGLTQYAAERLAKAALLHLCIEPAHTRKVLVLADALRKEDPSHPWIEIIESFNGHSADHHAADYSAAVMESVEDSLMRLYGVIEFYRHVLEAIAKKRPGFSERMLELCDNIAAIASIQQSAPTWGELPEELKQRLLHLNRMAEEILAAGADNDRQSAE